MLGQISGSEARTVMMTIIKPVFREGYLMGNIRFEGWEGTVSEGTTKPMRPDHIRSICSGWGRGWQSTGNAQSTKNEEGKEVGSSRRQV